MRIEFGTAMGSEFGCVAHMTVILLPWKLSRSSRIVRRSARPWQGWYTADSMLNTGIFAFSMNALKVWSRRSSSRLTPRANERRPRPLK